MKSVKPGSIVVAADGSVDADRAVQWAAEQADLEHRELVVVTAVHPVMPVASTLGPAYDYPVADLLASGLATGEDAAALAVRHRPAVSVQCVSEPGDPRDLLLGLSTEAHLLVLGSRGRGPIRSKLLGSVSAAVSKHARCPVVVCRPGTDLKVKNGVLVGADGTPESRPVLDFAFQQASLRGLPLTVGHCFWDVLASVDSPRTVSDSERDLDNTRLLLAESVAGFRETYPDVHVTEQVVRGRAIDYLTGIADRHNLLVVGRHPVDTVSRRIAGAISTVVTERTHTNVAIVPEERGA